MERGFKKLTIFTALAVLSLVQVALADHIADSHHLHVDHQAAVEAHPGHHHDHHHQQLSSLDHHHHGQSSHCRSDIHPDEQHDLSAGLKKRSVDKLVLPPAKQVREPARQVVADPPAPPATRVHHSPARDAQRPRPPPR